MSDKHFLWNFFDPKTIAIIGVRSTPGFGFALPIWLIKNGHGPKLRLVNPKGGEMHGQKVYKNVGEIPDHIDLAVIITPAPAVPGVLEELAAVGATNVIIESAGFAEIGHEGALLQGKIRRIAESKKMKVMGPNCVGVVNTENKFATSEAVGESLNPGHIGLVAQSGVFGSILLDAFPSKGLRVSRAVTLGNRLIVNEIDALEFYCDDPMTKAVVLYLEGAADGERLRKALAEITPIKPVIVLKSGRTTEGAAATASHTGSLAGSDEIYDGLFAQTGAIRAPDVGTMIDMAAVFSTQPLPRGNRICVLTTSGSMGAVAMDAAVKDGLVAAKISADTIMRVKEKAPPWMNVKNPLDVGPSGVFRDAFEGALRDPGVDMILGFSTIPYSVIEAFGPLGVNARTWLGGLDEMRRVAPEKPVVMAVIGHPEWRKQMAALCGDEIALVEFPEGGARALAAYSKYAAHVRSRSG